VGELREIIMSNKITRRSILATGTAAVGLRFIPKVAVSPAGRRVLTVYFDKAVGAMRAIDKVIP
jgi:hypothetical protein